MSETNEDICDSCGGGRYGGGYWETAEDDRYLLCRDCTDHIEEFIQSGHQ